MSLLICEANEIPKQTATASAGVTNRGAWLREMNYQNALHEAFCELFGSYVEELPGIVVTPAASPFLPDSGKYEGTDITPEQVRRASSKYSKKYYIKVDENSAEYKAATAANIARYGNEFGYLG